MQGGFREKFEIHQLNLNRRQKTQGDLPVVESPFRLAFYRTSPYEAALL